jgi:hypothetical protein
MNSMLEPLGALVGEWEMEAPRFPGGRGRVVFEWLEGGAYLVERSHAPDPAPDSTWIVGGDDAADSLTALYHDERGVSRVYRMSLAGGVWRVWRDAPGFWQRFTGRLGEDDSVILGAWESSPDGSTWEHDFDLIYRRVG